LAKVRIRGIYATALTKLLMERGHEIVQPSEKIARRFNLVVDNSPSNVTVKDSDDGDGVVVTGFPRETREVFNELSSSIPYVFKYLSRIELHSVYLARVVESRSDECIVETGDFKAELSPCKRSMGDKVIVGVRRAPLYPGERVVLSEGFRLTADLLPVLKSGEVWGYIRLVHPRAGPPAHYPYPLSGTRGYGLLSLIIDP